MDAFAVYDYHLFCNWTCYGPSKRCFCVFIHFTSMNYDAKFGQTLKTSNSHLFVSYLRIIVRLEDGKREGDSTPRVQRWTDCHSDSSDDLFSEK